MITNNCLTVVPTVRVQQFQISYPILNLKNLYRRILNLVSFNLKLIFPTGRKFLVWFSIFSLAMLLTEARNSRCQLPILFCQFSACEDISPYYHDFLIKWEFYRNYCYLNLGANSIGIQKNCGIEHSLVGICTSKGIEGLEQVKDLKSAWTVAVCKGHRLKSQSIVVNLSLRGKLSYGITKAVELNTAQHVFIIKGIEGLE